VLVFFFFLTRLILYVKGGEESKQSLIERGLKKLKCLQDTGFLSFSPTLFPPLILIQSCFLRRWVSVLDNFLFRVFLCIFLCVRICVSCVGFCFLLLQELLLGLRRTNKKPTTRTPSQSKKYKQTIRPCAQEKIHPEKKKQKKTARYVGEKREGRSSFSKRGSGRSGSRKGRGQSQ